MKNNTSKASKLAITQGKGFRLSFDNGYSLSVQIGQYNYCDNYSEGLGNDSELLHNITNPLASTTFEAAIIDKDGEHIVWPERSEGSDTVGGWIPIEDLPKWISYVSKLQDNSKKI